MQSFSLSEPTDIQADHLALITQQNQPLFIGVPFNEHLLKCGIHTALAENLYKEGILSIGKAAQLANQSIPEFTEYLSNLGISVVDYDATELDSELEYFA